MPVTRAPDPTDAVGGRPPVADAGDEEQLVLSDLVNRVLDKGVVISGHVTISVADIDLITLDLRVLITSIQTVISRAARNRSASLTDADVPLLPAAEGDRS
jgi:hypothetical protein